MSSLFRSRGVGTKIGLGYAMAALILVGAVGTTIWRVRETADITNRLIELRAPTAQASLGMLNGINRSLAALRGWMILGKDAFKEERSRSWAQEIEPSMAAMKAFAVHWTDPKNHERLSAIESKLGDFKTFQRQIEDIARTVENTPATKILLEQAAPKARVLATNITRMIDLEAELEATPERKALLGMMADVRGTLGLGLGAIRAYLLSGDENFERRFEELWTKNTKRFGDLTDNVQLLTPEQREAYELFAQARKQFDPLPPRMFEIRGGDEWNLANRWLATRAAPTAFAIKENLDAMIASQRRLMAADMAESTKRTASLVTMQWVLLGAGLALCTILGTIITRSITRPINRIIAGLNEGADQVSDAAGQVSSSSQSLAEGASEQASSLEETSSALEEMAAMTRTNAAGAEEANQRASQARDAAHAGDDTIQTLNQAMSAIDGSSGQISKIIKVIEEIAFQTNLLALNAAVEAARAGEHGKGFAVVADEVRNLAQRSAQAARETTGLIDDSVSKVREGTRVASEVGTALSTIVADVAKVSELIDGISKASQEQAQGVDQVNTAVSQMDKVTQQNAAGAEQSAAAAEQLSAQAATVKDIVQQLVVLVQGKSAQRSRSQSRSGSESGSRSGSGSWSASGSGSGSRSGSGPAWASASPAESTARHRAANSTGNTPRPTSSPAGTDGFGGSGSDPSGGDAAEQFIPFDDKDLASF